MDNKDQNIKIGNIYKFIFNYEKYNKETENNVKIIEEVYIIITKIEEKYIHYKFIDFADADLYQRSYKMLTNIWSKNNAERVFIKNDQNKTLINYVHPYYNKI